MEERLRRCCLWVGLAWIALGVPGHAQTPLGPEFRINQATGLTQDEPRIAVSRRGEFVVGWRHTVGETIPYTPLAAFRFYDSSGRSVSGEVFPARGSSGSAFPTALPAGGFRLFWGTDLAEAPQFFLQKYTPLGRAQGTPARILSPDQSMLVTGVVASPLGQTILSWLATYSDPRPSTFPTEVKIAYLTPRGRYLHGSPISVGFDPENVLFVGDVGVDYFGNAIVTWTGECGSDSDQCDVFAQRLAEKGEKWGSPIRVNLTTEGSQSYAKVAVAPESTSLVVWHGGDLREPTRSLDIYGQLFTSGGSRIGSELLINTLVEGVQLNPAVAVDAFGNFVVVWASLRPEGGAFGWDIRGQMYRYNGTPIATEFRLNSRQTGNEFSLPRVAFADNGTFVAVWNADDGDFDGVFAQRFAASPADEACVVSGRKLLCDTVREGGDPEISVPLPRERGEKVELADVDGDGREDPCIWKRTRWICDVEHRGLRWEPLPRLVHGGSIEEVLLGDVDGDGKAETCIFGGGRFSCDTRRDGGAADLVVLFGQKGDRTLLGDIDGDGRADPCVIRRDRLLCDTAREGNEANASIPFRVGRHIPFLGDFDGDGRDDPCVYAGRSFICDTSHDGVGWTRPLVFGHEGDQPLLGNLDGVGGRVNRLVIERSR